MEKVYSDLEKYWATEKDQWPPVEREWLWASKTADDLYTIENVPFYDRTFSYRDVVRVSRTIHGLKIVDVVSHSGHATLRILPSRGKQKDVDRLLRRIRVFDGTTEGGVNGLVAIDVPPNVAIQPIYDALREGERIKAWEVEQGFIPDDR